MTLILSAVLPDAVIQVSDRRLVRLRHDGSVLRENDEQNKAVFLCNRIAFAYTGLAQMGPYRGRTDEWLAQVLAAASGQLEALQALASAATDRFRHRLIRGLPAELRAHEFVGVGWARFDPADEQLEPYIAAVSNSRTDNGDWCAAREEFRVYLWRRTADMPVFAHAAGQPVTDAAGQALRATLRNASRVSVEETAESMLRCLRAVAQDNRLVGQGAMLTCLPRAAIEASALTGMNFYISGGPMAETTTFLSIPAGETDGTAYGPIVACEGRIMSGFTARAI